MVLISTTVSPSTRTATGTCGLEVAMACSAMMEISSKKCKQLQV